MLASSLYWSSLSAIQNPDACRLVTIYCISDLYQALIPIQVISKITTLIDVSLYGYGNAFQSFCTHRGVDALLQRIEVRVCNMTRMENFLNRSTM